MLRFSLRFVFALIALVALVLYAVIYYSPWLCTVCCNVLALTLVISAVGAIACQGRARTFSAGYLAMAVLCTWTAFGKTVFVNTPFSEHLLTQKLVDWVYESVHTNYKRYGDAGDSLQFEDGTVVEHVINRDRVFTEDGRRVYPREIFETMAHCLLAIILGLVAGAAAVVVWSVAERRRSRATSRQSLVAVRSEAEPRNENAQEVPRS